MRNGMLVLIFLVCRLDIYAQIRKDELKIMVGSAVNITYSKLEMLYRKSPNNNGRYLENLYLLNEQNLPLTYLDSATKSKFKYISIYDSRSKKILNRGINAWKVSTTLDKNKFTVYIIDFSIKYRKNNYSFSNGGGSETIFQYDCNEGKWKLMSSEYNGI